jgi:hypothetical protein
MFPILRIDHRIGIANAQVTGLGLPPNMLVINKNRRVLPQDAGVMALVRFHATQHGDHKTLWPAIPHQAQAGQKCERLVSGKPVFVRAL